MKIYGFAKVRNEIIREGNLYRLLQELEQLDGGVICDDASTDGTAEVLSEWCAKRPRWCLTHVTPEDQDWSQEMAVKQRMLDELKIIYAADSIYGSEPTWVLWLDADELLLAKTGEFRAWLEKYGDDADIWGFHYTQPWRTLRWARTDSGFDSGMFWKLWRMRADLTFEVRPELHTYQFPSNYVEDVLDYVNPRRARARRPGRAARLGRAKAPGYSKRAQPAPFEVLHLGNVGKNLVWKAIVYRDSGPLAGESLKRHLYFGAEATYRPSGALEALHGSTFDLPITKEEPVEFTDQEKAVIVRMGRLRDQKGLVTVIVPTYNRGHLLDRTLASVLAQTYKHWVCVVLDDGSTDHTPEIMRAWQDRDPRFFYCRYETNRGGVAMNEIGMSLACEFGEFWTRLGSDDYWKPHKLSADIAAFNLGAQACYGPYVDLREQPLSPEGRDIRNAPTDARTKLLDGQFCVSWANIAVRTDVLRQVQKTYGRFADPSLRNMEDWIVNVRIAEFTDFTWRGLSVDGELLIGPHDIHPSKLIPDAVWRIGADGASSNDEVCAKDTMLTRRLLAASPPHARQPSAPCVKRWLPWHGQSGLGRTVIARSEYTETHVCLDAYGDRYMPIEDAIAEGRQEAFAVRRETYPEPTPATDIIYSMCEDLWEGAAEGLDDSSLQKALDDWYAAQDQKGAGFVVDDKLIVDLTK